MQVGETPFGKIPPVEAFNSSFTRGTYANIGGIFNIPAKLVVGISETFDNTTLRRLFFFDVGPNRDSQLHSFDQGDLFAQLNIDLLIPRIEGARLTADPKVSSARPHRLVVEKSAELSTFAPDAQGKITATPDPKVLVVSVRADDPKKFMRVVAEVRP